MLYFTVVGTEEGCRKNVEGNALSLTLVEDISADSSEVSSMTMKKPHKSKTSTPLPPTPKKQPIYNKMFADFSNTELKECPRDILNQFPQLKVSSFFK